jgi:hypothetical protein
MTNSAIVAGRPCFFKEVELQARLARRAAKISERANFYGRLVIRFRIWWFVRRLVQKRRVPVSPQAIHSN